MVSPVSRLIYVGDPMCSWCWGFAPEIEELSGEHAVDVVVGGLRPGPMAQELDDRLAGFLRHHWMEIQERTGQAFDTTFLDRRDGWIYDTEPAAIAVTQFRQIDPPRTLAYFTRIQHAFYAEGRDVTDPVVLSQLSLDFGLDAAVFASGLAEEEARERAWADFAQTRNWGISGFPTLIGELLDGRLALLARGWTQAEFIRTRVTSLSEALAG